MSKVIANIRLFFQGAVLSYIALFAWFRPSQYIATKVVGPLAQILFFTLMGKFGTSGESADFYIIGNAIQITALSGIFGVTFSLSGDRWNGTLPYLFGTPANRMTMFLGRAVIHVIDGIFGVLIGFTWGVTLLGLNLANTDPIGAPPGYRSYDLQHLGLRSPAGKFKLGYTQCYVYQQHRLLRTIGSLGFQHRYRSTPLCASSYLQLSTSHARHH